MRSRFKAAVIITLCVVFVIASGEVRASVTQSLSLCVKLLIPSLFPFFVLSGMLTDLGLADLFGAPTAAMIIGLICGYPLGTRAVCGYYQSGELSPKQAKRLLVCTANASPAFLVVAVGKGILHDVRCGILLLTLQTLGAFLFYLCYVPQNTRPSGSGKCISLIGSTVQNLKSAGEQMLQVCSATVFFGIFADAANHIPVPPVWRKITVGMMEITHGCALFASNELLPLAFVVGLSGLCVWMQCFYYIRQTDLPTKYLACGKLMQAIWLIIGVILYQNHLFSIFLLICLIFILTNFALSCIIKPRGCDQF